MRGKKEIWYLFTYAAVAALSFAAGATYAVCLFVFCAYTYLVYSMPDVATPRLL